MSKPYDFLVIGGGSAGYAAARTAHEYGMKTAVVDGAEELGGLCILRGCMPSKTLIESANRHRSMRRAEEFGLRAGETAVHPAEIIARKRRLIDDFAGYRQGQLEDGRFDLFRGTGAFTGSHEVEVTPLGGGEPQRVAFRSALVSTGSRINHIPIEGLEEAGYWTSDDTLEAEDLPESFIVLGGGAIAMEMACYLEGLGRQVTVVQRSDQLLSDSDRDLAKALEEALQQRPNMEVHTGTSLKRVTREGENGPRTVHFDQNGEERSVTADHILQALGRRPATDGLHVEAAGIERPKGGGLPADTDQRTTTEHIFAAGDVCGPYELVHIAIEQGEIAAHNAARDLGFSEEPERRTDYRLKLYGIFTDPQVAMVGLSETEAREAGRKIAVATSPFDDHGKSMVRGETHGFVKMMADPDTGEILGASAVGPEVVELIHEIVVAMHFRATADEFLTIPHYHPTLSEIWTYPAEDLSISA